MTTYSDIEIQTAENLLKEGYKWIAKDKHGSLYAYSYKPYKAENVWYAYSCSELIICESVIPIFPSIKWEDKEPTSLESIVHPQILDDAERRYLKGVIRPFRKSVISIEKSTFYEEGEAICIDTEKGYTVLPQFEEGTMYKGMEVGREYTPEELGL